MRAPQGEGDNAVNFFTIGVYGSTQEAFFAALQSAGVDTFCDIRWRRGVRGKEYAFVNGKRLQQRLADLGIAYVHVRELAPPPALRQRQYDSDKANHIAKRQRTELHRGFVEAYHREILGSFHTADFVAKLPPNAHNVVLFCVERKPTACHRSIVAQTLEQELGVTFEHLLPE